LKKKGKTPFLSNYIEELRRARIEVKRELELEQARVGGWTVPVAVMTVHSVSRQVEILSVKEKQVKIRRRPAADGCCEPHLLLLEKCAHLITIQQNEIRSREKRESRPSTAGARENPFSTVSLPSLLQQQKGLIVLTFARCAAAAVCLNAK
jgi:hypothetical protein